MNIRMLVTLALMFTVLKFVKLARKLYYYRSVLKNVGGHKIFLGFNMVLRGGETRDELVQ